MPNVRVYELARDIGIPSKSLVEKLRNQGIKIKSHMSTLDKETADLILDLFREEASPAPSASSVPAPTVDPVPLTSPVLAAVSPPTATPDSAGHVLRLPEALTVKDFAAALHLKTREVLMQLMTMGTIASINHVIDLGTASAVATQLGKDVTLISEEKGMTKVAADGASASLEPRAPVVTIMGHVDHGKTSLLDAIRVANVQATERGGITQHIGAYEVATDRGTLVFLDTPGHEAFTAMRARGAQVTDIVVLVVAADDGVMPQTREAIAHAQAANVPIVVAINKIDLPETNPDRVKQQLAELDLLPEQWGGTTIYVEVSAKQRFGLDELLEMLLLQAEVLELQADPHQKARGIIVEARLDKTRGPVATVLIQQGTLCCGDAYVAGIHHGRVRAILDYRGRKIKAAGPSTPVEVLGITDVPAAGDTFMVVEDERKARQISSVRQDKQRTQQLSQTHRVTLDDLYRQIAAGEVKDLYLIIKADVQGSVQALWDALAKFESDKVRLHLIHGSTGGITESDIMLASASNAIVIGFNIRPTPQAVDLAMRERVDVRLYTVIYEAISDVENAMVGLLEPTYTEKLLGRAEVRVTFHITRVGTIAGCYIQEGTIRRNASARVVRDSVVVHEGRVVSLRRVRDVVDEVVAGFECGIGLGRFQDLKEGDVIESFVLEEVTPHL
ncbi:Translation initiation factor IF-2 [Candidatus Entotheonellaceae bacterium PAL068K]